VATKVNLNETIFVIFCGNVPRAVAATCEGNAMVDPERITYLTQSLHADRFQDSFRGRPFLHEMTFKNNSSCTNYKTISLLQVGRQLNPPILWGYHRKNMLDSTLQEPRWKSGWK
jgi:hypothetical protein